MNAQFKFFVVVISLFLHFMKYTSVFHSIGVKQQPLTNQCYFIIKIGTFNINSLNVNDFNILLYDTQNTVLSSYNVKHVYQGPMVLRLLN
jgi:hypothetical protein